MADMMWPGMMPPWAALVPASTLLTLALNVCPRHCSLLSAVSIANPVAPSPNVTTRWLLSSADAEGAAIVGFLVGGRDISAGDGFLSLEWFTTFLARRLGAARGLNDVGVESVAAGSDIIISKGLPALTG